MEPAKINGVIPLFLYGLSFFFSQCLNKAYASYVCNDVLYCYMPMFVEKLTDFRLMRSKLSNLVIYRGTHCLLFISVASAIELI